MILLITYLLEMRGRQDLSDRLHQGVSDDNGDITSGVSGVSSRLDSHPPLGQFSERREVGRCKAVWCFSNVELEHPSTGLNIW